MFTSVVSEPAKNPDAIVLPVYTDLSSENAPSEVEDALKRKEFGGKSGQIAEVFCAKGPRYYLLGLGEKDKLTNEIVRSACLRLASRIDKAAVKTLEFQFGSGASASIGELIGISFGLASFQVKMFAGSLNSVDMGELSVYSKDKNLQKGIQKGLAIADAANWTRSIVNTPPNIATPLYLAEIAQKKAKELGLKCEVFKGQQLIKEKLEGLTTVGRASEHEPCMIRLEYSPGKSKKGKVVLVGKAITFDTGGYSLKQKGGMAGMKYDKAGGCAVLGIMQAVAEVIKPDFPVVGLIMAAENAVAGNAYMPDDIMTFRNGVTVEVTNTDAEGRLVLADGLCYACDKEDPAVILDFATLTGGVVTALGSFNAGLFSENDELCQSLSESGKASGENLWRLPVDQKYRDMMRSKVADIVNSVAGGKAHPCQGAAFLSFFVKPGVEWAHLDIAGVAKFNGDQEFLEGPSGYGVQLITHWLSER